MRTLSHTALKNYLDSAPLFKKVATLRKQDLEFITPETERVIETIVDGKMETSRMAKVGDVVVPGVQGEKFVSSLKSFKALHQQDPENPDLYHAMHTVKAVLLKEDFIIKACWGEDMVIRAGGVAVERVNDNKFYGNQGNTFNETYFRAAPNGTILCPLTLPLEEQLDIASKAGAVRHQADILDRISLREHPNRPSYFRKNGLRDAQLVPGGQV